MNKGEVTFLCGMLLTFIGACFVCLNNCLVVVLCLLGILLLSLSAFRGSET